MALNQLSISSLIAVDVSLTQTAAQAQNLNTMLILSNTDVLDPVERYRLYTGIDSVAADFGQGSASYAAAVAYFSQTPKPRQLYIGLWARAAKPGGLRCGVLTKTNQNIADWNAITSGGFTITINGGAGVSVTGLNFSAALDMPGVAAVIQAGLTAATVAATVAWDPGYQRFYFKTTANGSDKVVAFLTPPATGTNIADDLKGRTGDGGYSYTGLDPEGAGAVTALYDELIGQKWYALATSADFDVADSVLLSFAAAIEASTNKHLYAVTIDDTAALLPSSTTDLAYQLKQLGYSRTFCQYSITAQAAISALARLITTNYAASGTAITLMYKQQPGLVPENLTPTQAQALKDKNCNVFVAYDNDTAILQHGTMVNGTFADIVTGTDWLATTIQTELWNILYTTTTKIPQTDAGVNLLVTSVERLCTQAVNNGLLAPGVWQGPVFGALSFGDYLAKGFYVYAERVGNQTIADRAARRAPPIQVAAKLAGAIHSVDLSIIVNQ